VKVFRTFDAQLRTNLLVLFIAGLLFWSSVASLLPTLPLYLKDVGATKQEIGIVMGSFAIGMLLFRPWLGWLADKRGRKLVLLIGILVAAVAPIGYLVVNTTPLMILLRIFHGISLAAFATGFNALVVDMAPPQQRGEVIGYMSLINPIGVAIGPALGGFLQAGAGYYVLFLISAELAFVGLLGILPISNPPLPKQPQNNTKKPQFWQILFSPRVRTPAVILLLVGLTFGALHTFVPLYIESTGVDLNPGLFYTAAAIASFSVRLFTGRESDRFGRGLFITFSLVLYTSSMLLLSFANDTVSFLLAAIMEGAGSGMLIPMITTLVADRAEPQERGRVFAVCLMGLDIGIVMAGPIVGFAAEQFGFANMFGFAAGLTALGILIFLTQSSKDLPSSFRFALGRGQDAYALKNL
jgi:MFS family permease